MQRAAGNAMTGRTTRLFWEVTRAVPGTLGGSPVSRGVQGSQEKVRALQPLSAQNTHEP